MGQQARQAAAGQGRDRRGEAPRPRAGASAASRVSPSRPTRMLGTPHQARQGMGATGDKCRSPGSPRGLAPFLSDQFIQSRPIRISAGRVLAGSLKSSKVIQIGPLVRIKFGSLGLPALWLSTSARSSGVTQALPDPGLAWGHRLLRQNPLWYLILPGGTDRHNEQLRSHTQNCCPKAKTNDSTMTLTDPFFSFLPSGRLG